MAWLFSLASIADLSTDPGQKSSLKEIMVYLNSLNKPNNFLTSHISNDS
jgi:hypothetical protein